VGETLEGRDALLGGQRARLERLAADGVAGLTFVECLDECERGDVVVARPAPAVRRGLTEARPVWLERVAGDELTDHLCRWLVAGGPGVAALPTALAQHVIAKEGTTGAPVQVADADPGAAGQG
jgi:hypothetical protein